MLITKFEGVRASAVIGAFGGTRGNKLVHLTAPATMVGRIVRVRVDHAGPYSLTGILAE